MLFYGVSHLDFLMCSVSILVLIDFTVLVVDKGFYLFVVSLFVGVITEVLANFFR
ncbi:hypothetical protein SRM1_03143 [Pseudomonas fluorescens]|nr:hypothetical protein SRM1_03143 [Pseudomonas fluorescens]